MGTKPRRVWKFELVGNGEGFGMNCSIVKISPYSPCDIYIVFFRFTFF
jgi:hypothetical protein